MAKPVATAHFPDISHYTDPASIDFHAVANGGVPLVITKASQGSHYTDPTYAGFAQRIRSVPLILGAYCYLNVAPEGPQVAHFIDVAHLQKGDLQPVIDAEEAGLGKDETFAAMEDLEGRGFSPILYASRSFFTDVLGSPTKWWLWMAAYRATLPTLPVGVRLFAWQHADAASCPGIAHPVDMSYLYVPVADLKTKFCIV